MPALVDLLAVLAAGGSRTTRETEKLRVVAAARERTGERRNARGESEAMFLAKRRGASRCKGIVGGVVVDVGFEEKAVPRQASRASCYLRSLTALSRPVTWGD